MGASAPHTKRVQSCQRLSHNRLGAEEQVIIVALSPSSPLSWLGVFFFFFSLKTSVVLPKLEFQLGKHTHAVCTLSHKYGQESLSLASCLGKEAE